MMSTEEAKYLRAFGKRLANIRKQHGLTQEELADKLNISRLSVAYFETGRRWPRITTLKKIAKCLQVDLGDIFQGI
jgi:transcriptional regulator with XRE-family HTH domain